MSIFQHLQECQLGGSFIRTELPERTDAFDDIQSQMVQVVYNSDDKNVHMDIEMKLNEFEEVILKLKKSQRFAYRCIFDLQHLGTAVSVIDDVVMANNYVTITDDDGTDDVSMTHDYVTLNDENEAVTNSLTDCDDSFEQKSDQHSAKLNEVIAFFAIVIRK